MNWTKSVLVMELDDGTVLFPSRDDEGNEGGALFSQNAEGEEGDGYPCISEYSMDPEEEDDFEEEEPVFPVRVSKPWTDPREKGTLRRLLKKIQKGQVELHYNNERSLKELEEQGYIARMLKFRKGRVPYFRVELTEEGKAA